MKRPRGYPKIGTSFWDTHPFERVYATMLLTAGGYTYQDIIEALGQEFGENPSFNMCQLSKLKQKLRVTKR